MEPGPRRPAPSALVPNIGLAHDAAASFQPAQPAQSFLHGKGHRCLQRRNAPRSPFPRATGACQVCLTRQNVGTFLADLCPCI